MDLIGNIIGRSGINRSGPWQIYGRTVPSMADDATHTCPTGIAGIGAIVFEDSTAGIFIFDTDGTVTELVSKNGDMAYADTDAKGCVYDGGSGIVIKNRLGAAKNMTVILVYT